MKWNKTSRSRGLQVVSVVTMFCCGGTFKFWRAGTRVPGTNAAMLRAGTRVPPGTRVGCYAAMVPGYFRRRHTERPI
eukprot:2800478-Rhodomonas_salina.2